MRPRGKSGPIQRNQVHANLPKDIEYFGETSLKVFLVVASRNYRGETTTIQHLADAVGISLGGANHHMNRLQRLGLVEFEQGTCRTVRPSGRFGLELVDEPPCLTRLKDELAPQCQPRGNFGPTPTVSQAA